MVPSDADKKTLEALFAQMGDESTRKDSSGRSDLTRGLTIAVLRCRLVVDRRIRDVAGLPRVGLFTRPAVYHGVVRLNVTEHGAARLSIRLQVPENLGEMLERAETTLHDTSAPASRVAQTATAHTTTTTSYPVDAPDAYRSIDLLVAEQFKRFPVATPRLLGKLMSVALQRSCTSICAILGTPLSAREAIRALNKAKSFPAVDGAHGVCGKAYFAGLPFALGCTNGKGENQVKLGGKGSTKDGGERVGDGRGSGDDIDNGDGTSAGAFKFGFLPLQRDMLPDGGMGKPPPFSGKEQDVHMVYKSAVDEELAKGDGAGAVLGRWEFVVQPRDIREPSHSIALGNAVWSEAAREYAAVGELTILKESVPDAEHPARFSPWNMLAAHRPLGPLNEMRHVVYRAHRRALELSSQQKKMIGEEAQADVESAQAAAAATSGLPLTRCPVSGVSAEHGVEMPHKMMSQGYVSVSTSGGYSA